MVLRQSDSSSPESGFRRTNRSPNTRHRKGRWAHKLEKDFIKIEKRKKKKILSNVLNVSIGSTKGFKFSGEWVGLGTVG